MSNETWNKLLTEYNLYMKEMLSECKESSSKVSNQSKRSVECMLDTYDSYSVTTKN